MPYTPEMPDGTLRSPLGRNISAGVRCGSGITCSRSGGRLYGGISTCAAASVLPASTSMGNPMVYVLTQKSHR